MNGWNFNPTTVTLTAVGVNTTIAEDAVPRRQRAARSSSYTGSVHRSGGGTHTVDYFSTDTLGNIEPTKTTTFQIDATAPVDDR